MKNNKANCLALGYFHFKMRLGKLEGKKYLWLKWKKIRREFSARENMCGEPRWSFFTEKTCWWRFSRWKGLISFEKIKSAREMEISRFGKEGLQYLKDQLRWEVGTWAKTWNRENLPSGWLEKSTLGRGNYRCKIRRWEDASSVGGAARRPMLEGSLPVGSRRWVRKETGS